MSQTREKLRDTTESCRLIRCATMRGGNGDRGVGRAHELAQHTGGTLGKRRRAPGAAATAPRSTSTKRDSSSDSTDSGSDSVAAARRRKARQTPRKDNKKDDVSDDASDNTDSSSDSDDDSDSYGDSDNSLIGSSESEADDVEQTPEFKIFSDSTTASAPVPEPISMSSFVFAMGCHPSNPLVALGDIEGSLSVWKYDTETLKTTQTFQRRVHSDSCRSLCWTPSGNYLVTSSSDKSIMVHDTENGKVILRKRDAHKAAVNVISCLDETLLATGDDRGVVKIWDSRQKKMVRKYKENTDYITDFTYVEDKTTLLCTSGDGSLSVFDIKHNKPIAISEPQDEELLALTVLKNGTKACVSTGEGSLLFFSLGHWGDCTDRYTALQHTGSIDTMLQLDDCQIVIGSSDGAIRRLSTFPHKVSGVLGQHCAEGVEAISLTADEKYVVSSGHDYTVKFWSL